MQLQHFCSIDLDDIEKCADATDTVILVCRCSNEVGITVGVIILVECLIVVITVIFVVLCWWR